MNNDKECYVCGAKYSKKKKKVWFYTPLIMYGKIPKGLALCNICAKLYMKKHYAWKHVKKTLTALKKK
tara:strand:+ start:36 stop:239 length:204 start_codon:yes stop_codon:yes gene_type:complete